MSRKDKLRTTLTVDGRDCGVVAARTGGGVDSDETKYRAGAGQKKKSYGGQRDPQNVTLTGVEELEMRGLIDWLMTRAGEGRATVVEQPLGPDNNAWGPPRVWTGTVKAVRGGESDSNSSDVTEFEIEISTEG